MKQTSSEVKQTFRNVSESFPSRYNAGHLLDGLQGE